MGDGMVSIYITSIFTVTAVTLLLAERGLPPYIYRWEKTKTKILNFTSKNFVEFHNQWALQYIAVSNLYQSVEKKNPHSKMNAVGLGLRRWIFIGRTSSDNSIVRRFVLRKDDLTLFKQFQYPFIVVAD